MKKNKFILYLLIIIFTVVMPIIPSTSHIGFINLSGDAILYIIIVYSLLIIIFDKNIRNKLLNSYKVIFKDYINIFMLIWVLAMFISVSYSRVKALAFTESLRLSSYVILFLILKYFIDEDKIYKYILKSYMLSSFIIGVFAIYQSLAGYGEIKITKFGSEVRVASFLENSNNLGMYFVFAVFPFLLLLIKEKNRKNKLIYLMMTLLSLVNIIFSYSRNALIGFAVGIMVLIAVFGIRYLFLTIIPALFVFFIPSLSNRIKDISDVSQNLSRIKLWTLAGLIIKDHPILGIGNGNFGKYKNDYPINFAEYNITEVYHPHNAFLKAYCELGIFGLISFTGMIVSSFFVLHKFIKNQRNDFYNWFYTGVFISLFSMVFMNLIDSFFSAPKVIVYYFIVMGVCEGIKIRQGKISR